MSSQVVRIFITAALFVHGVGHLLGFFMPARSWLLPGVAEPTLRIVGGALWLLIMAGFVASSLGYFGLVPPGNWWRPVTLAFAVLSLAGLILFWGDWPAFNTVGLWA